MELKHLYWTIVKHPNVEVFSLCTVLIWMWLWRYLYLILCVCWLHWGIVNVLLQWRCATAAVEGLVTQWSLLLCRPLFSAFCTPVLLQQNHFLFLTMLPIFSACVLCKIFKRACSASIIRPHMPLVCQIDLNSVIGFTQSQSVGIIACSDLTLFSM